MTAYGKGGVPESVTDRRTGLYFHKQTLASLVAALEQFDFWQFSMHRPDLRTAAERFSEARFRKQMVSFIDKVLADEVGRRH